MKVSHWRIGLLGACLIALLGASGVFAVPTYAAAYVRGWSVQGGMLCYGFSNGAWHCTSHWHKSGGLYISDNTPFVPSQGGVVALTPPPQPQPTGGCSAAGLPAVGYVANGMHWAPGGIPNDSCYASQSAPYGGALSLWKIPPAPFNHAYVVNPALYPFRFGWPTCSWWGREMNPDYAFGKGAWGQTVPKVGATVRYAPGVLGASSGGHVGHVIAVYTNGWFLSAEMNMYFNGGGAGKVVYRFVPRGVSGVTFVY